MNEIYVALPFVQFLIAAVLLIVVFMSAPREPLNRLFALFLIAIAAWGITIFGMRDSFPDAAKALEFENVVLAIVPFTGVFFYHFVIRFIGEQSPVRLIRAFYGLALIAGVFSLLGWSAPQMITKFYGFAPQLGWAFPIVLLASYPPVVLAFWKLTGAIRRSGNGIKRTQLVLLRWGVIAAVLGGTSDFLPSLGLQIYPLGVLGNIAFGILATAAVTRYRLMNLRLVLRRGLAYTIISSGLLGFHGLAVLATWSLVKDLSGTAMVIAIAGTIIIVGIAVQPFISKLQKAVDRAFFRERADRLETLFSMSADLRDNTDLGEVLSRLVVGLDGAVHPHWVTVLLPDREETSFITAIDSRNSGGDENSDHTSSIQTGGGLSRWFEVNRAPLAGQMLDTDPLLQGISIDEREAIEGIDAVLLVPMIAKDTLTGILAIGPKIVDGNYDPSDIDFLMAVADHSAVAIENARLYATEVERRAEMERLDSVRTSLLHTVSHELKSPITAIKISTELLEATLETKPDGPPHARMIKTLKSGIERLERLTQEALDYATMQSAKLELQLEDANLEDVVRDVLALVPAIESRNQKLTFTVQKEMPQTRSDSRRVERILLNLITNASKYTPEGGRIAVSITAQGDSHTIQVSDTGMGIPEDDLEMIFSPFFRSKVPDNSPVAGSGLGLSIARFLAEQHGGSLTARSEVGTGSTFTLVLPAGGPDSATELTPGAMGHAVPLRSPARVPVASIDTEAVATPTPSFILAPNPAGD
ncbi:MAG: hypothetical protein IH868_05020 [Chloroflexi bacterium]|nr:hypothetical protein [Chloroflexota bacterium]